MSTSSSARTWVSNCSAYKAAEWSGPRGETLNKSWGFPPSAASGFKTRHPTLNMLLAFHVPATVMTRKHEVKDPARSIIFTPWLCKHQTSYPNWSGAEATHRKSGRQYLSRTRKASSGVPATRDFTLIFLHWLHTNTLFQLCGHTWSSNIPAVDVQ